VIAACGSKDFAAGSQRLHQIGGIGQLAFAGGFIGCDSTLVPEPGIRAVSQ
jgi:hypothetical protein